jgi:hypothetical protein
MHVEDRMRGIDGVGTHTSASLLALEYPRLVAHGWKRGVVQQREEKRGVQDAACAAGEVKVAEWGVREEDNADAEVLWTCLEA